MSEFKSARTITASTGDGRRQVSLVPREMIEQIEVLAIRQKTGRSQVIRELLRKALLKRSK